MLLKKKFYDIIESHKDGATGVYHVAILPECSVYQGHFPGDPICPGVCNIETIKECVCDLLGCDLRIQSIKQCRLTAIATPTVCPEVSITINCTPKDEAFIIQATIADDKQTYMEFKGTLA